MQSRPRGMWGEAQLAFSPLAVGSDQGCTHRGPFVLIHQPSRGHPLLLPQMGGGGPGSAVLPLSPSASLHDPHIAFLHTTLTCPAAVPTQWSASPRGPRSPCS